jgi:hypothetical protein
MPRWLAVLVVLCLPHVAMAAPQQTPASEAFAALAQANTYPVRLDSDGRLSGPGVEFLLGEAENAQFVAFGEEHGEAQSNRFISALFPLLQARAGYQHLMVEQGAIVSSQISASPLRGNIEAISAHAAAHPHAFTFVSDQELAMLASVSGVSAAAAPIWGCEVEFGVGHALAELSRLLPPRSAAGGAVARLAADALRAEVPRSSPIHFIREPGVLERLVEIQDLVEQETQDVRARAIAATLARSSYIFSLFAAGERRETPGFYSNALLREDFMVSECLARYREAEAMSASPPRAVLKLGHQHVMHGLSPTRVRTMGTFFADLARLNDRDFFLLSVIAYGPEGGSYPQLESSRLIWPLFGPALDRTAAFAVIDFRPLREHPHIEAAVAAAGLDAAGTTSLRQMLHAYDGALVVLDARQGSFERVNGRPIR